MYVTVLAMFLASFLMIYRIVNSPFGEVLHFQGEMDASAIEPVAILAIVNCQVG
jgi:hypothetical protein